MLCRRNLSVEVSSRYCVEQNRSVLCCFVHDMVSVNFMLLTYISLQNISFMFASLKYDCKHLFVFTDVFEISKTMEKLVNVILRSYDLALQLGCETMIIKLECLPWQALCYPSQDCGKGANLNELSFCISERKFGEFKVYPWIQGIQCQRII